MADTPNLTLPLLAAGQAQKHVTLNEALSRLDMLVMLSVKSRTRATPPPAPLEGDRYAIATGPTGAWIGRESQLAVFVNGGWEFLAPLTGWRAFVEDEGCDVVFQNGIWTLLGSAPATSIGQISVLEFEHQVQPGGSQSTLGTIPAGSLVFGVTARVVEELTGVFSWSLGTAGAPRRYGTGLAAGKGSSLVGTLCSPLSYTSSTPLVVTPDGDSFAGGKLRFKIHYLLLQAPDP